MKEKVYYRILAKASQADLARTVATFLNNGWELAGGVGVAIFPDGVGYIQAVVLHTIAPPEKESEGE